MTRFEFTVIGTPGPQGSKSFSGFAKTGRPIMRESSAKVKPWREAVVSAVLEQFDRRPLGALHDSLPIFGQYVPVHLSVIFYFRRPKAHFGTGKNAGVIKPNAPRWVTVYPDESKLIRSTEDAITTTGIWHDDGQVVRHSAAQVYSDDHFQGAKVVIMELDNERYGE